VDAGGSLATEHQLALHCLTEIRVAGSCQCSQVGSSNGNDIGAKKEINGKHHDSNNFEKQIHIV